MNLDPLLARARGQAPFGARSSRFLASTTEMQPNESDTHVQRQSGLFFRHNDESPECVSPHSQRCPREVRTSVSPLATSFSLWDLCASRDDTASVYDVRMRTGTPSTRGGTSMLSDEFAFHLFYTIICELYLKILVLTLHSQIAEFHRCRNAYISNDVLSNSHSNYVTVVFFNKYF